MGSRGTARDPESRRFGREAVERSLHLAVLSALAVAQPVFDILGRNPTFFAVRDSSSAEIVVFALAVTLLPPTALTFVELSIASVSRGLARVVHVFFVGVLLGLFALVIITHTGALTGRSALAVSAVAGTTAALLYSRMRLARSFVTMLAPTPLLFLALFLFESPVSKLVFVETPTVHATPVKARTPVVLIVFDEFSTVSLMNDRQRVDARRFPNFASLAADSTWFRNASARSWLSEVAVPSLLTAREPRSNRVPIFSDYPENIFTLLGARYRVRAIESLTRLCPREICRDRHLSNGAARTTAGAYGSLASDVGIVYLHLLLPDPYARRLPRIDESWGDFGGREEPTREITLSDASVPCARNTCRFAESITADRRPTFYFWHAMLPHVPYVYLPSGRRYVVDARVLRGLDNGVWTEGRAALDSQQRYLFQVAYTDRVLGHVLDRLRATGIYDRALLIVTADHGVSFRLGEPRRAPTAANLADIAFVPLFVKLPGQSQARIDDSPATTIDVLPTVARVLHIAIPWRIDGRPLVGPRVPAAGRGPRVPAAGRVSVRRNGYWIHAPIAASRVRRSQTLARQVAVFGTGSLESLYRIGPHRQLLGRAVSRLSVLPTGTRVEINARSLLDAVDPDSAIVPSYVEGEIRGRVASGQAVAVAVNGRVVATTQAFHAGNRSRFSTFVPETALRPGENVVAVYVVRERGPGLVLEQLRDDDRRFDLVERDGREVIESQGKRISIRPGVIRGAVRIASEGSTFVFSGNAKHRAARRPIHTLVVFAGGRGVYWGRSEDLRPNRLLGQRLPRGDAFAFVLPRSLLPSPGRGQAVRVFAVRFGLATELRYQGRWPWAH